MGSLGLENNTIVSLQATIYKGDCSDIVSISVVIDKKYENYHVVDVHPTFVDLSKGNFTITIPKSSCENLICSILTENGWAAKSCSIVFSTDLDTTIQIQKSGTYSLIFKPSTKETTESLCSIISLAILAIIYLSIFYYFESKNERNNHSISFDKENHESKASKRSSISSEKKKKSL